MEQVEQTTQQNQMFTKEQAAEFLGKSTKAIQRYTAAGQLPVVYVKEKGSQRAFYKLEDLKHFKEYGYVDKPVDQGNKLPLDSMDSIDKPSMDTKNLVQGQNNISQNNPEKAIAKLIAQVLTEAQRRGLVALAATGDSSPVGKQSNKLTVPIADKMVLSIAEASVLSGRPQNELRQAFQQGKLKGVKLGKGIKVRKKDLEAYIDSLFGDNTNYLD